MWGRGEVGGRWWEGGGWGKGMVAAAEAGWMCDWWPSRGVIRYAPLQPSSRVSATAHRGDTRSGRGGEGSGLGDVFGIRVTPAAYIAPAQSRD